MGNFTKLHGNNGKGIIITPEIDEFLKNSGFTVDTNDYGGTEKGWSNGYTDKIQLYYYRVHITSASIQINKEYDCGGDIAERTYAINLEDIESVESFTKLLDKAYDFIEL
jgi:hypothetical protein